MASAAILAGGRASRFGGSDKSALVVGGRSILDRQIEELDRRQLRMVDFLADARVRVVESAELAALGDHHRLLSNVNTPVEYDGLDRTIGHEL